MANRKSKSEADKFAQAIREIQASCPENKKCFECEQRGPTYVNMTIGAFVCTKCSGMLRGINPPHRIKSISMSSFTSDEVEFIRNKGNVYCDKVWLGLYDKSHGYMVDLKDDEAVKDFIIQKYEKKRYYVDPSTIKHSLDNAVSSTSTNSQPSSDAGPASTAKPSFGTGMIGTTIQLHSKNRQASQRGSSPSVPLTAPPINESVTRSTNKMPLPVTAPAASFSSNVASLAGLAVPAPTVDPFAPSRQAPPTGVSTSISGFGVNFPPPGSSSATSSQAPKSQAKFEENFANFDVAVFDKSASVDPLPHQQLPIQHQQPSNVLKPISPHSTVSSSGGTTISKPESNGPAIDRYAALKDLDEIFKSTVVLNETTKPIAASNSTGASIFGTSPVSSYPQTAVLSGTPPGAAAPPPGQNFFAGLGNGGQGSNGGLSTTSAAPPSSSPNWVASWPSHSAGTSNITSGTATNGVKPSSNLSSNAPINPFTGASNLTQLNTSPWPTTGTSPVQTHAPAWPAMDGFNGSIGKENTSSKVNSAHTASAFPDPFGAAPTTSSLHQQLDSTDLFANAPKPSLSNDKKVAEMTGFGGLFDKLPANTGDVSNDIFNPVAVDPWSTPPTAKQVNENIFTSTMVPASNPNNPFL